MDNPQQMPAWARLLSLSPTSSDSALIEATRRALEAPSEFSVVGVAALYAERENLRAGILALLLQIEPDPGSVIPLTLAMLEAGDDNAAGLAATICVAAGRWDFAARVLSRSPETAMHVVVFARRNASLATVRTWLEQYAGEARAAELLQSAVVS